MPGAGVVFLSLSFSPPVSLVMVSKPAGQEAVKSDGFTYGLFDSYMPILHNQFICLRRAQYILLIIILWFMIHQIGHSGALTFVNSMKHVGVLVLQIISPSC